MQNLLPEFILENYKNNKFEGDLQAFSMFIDVSGFTAMTEKLLKGGSDGPEILSNILKNIFRSTVTHVYKSGGFITTFAGDAFTAIFPTLKDIPQYEQAHNVLHCAEQILQSFIENPLQNTKYGSFEFKVTIGISTGEVIWAIVGGKDKGFYFRGEAIDDCASSEKSANKNEVVIDNKIKQLLKPDDLETEPINENYFKVNKFTNVKQSTTIAKPGLSHLGFTKEIFSRKFFTDSIFKVKEPGEFRNVVSVFISFDDVFESEELDKFFTIIIDRINHYSGYIENIDFGDKGGVVACFFGAPISFEDNIQRALDFTLTSRKKISGEESLKQLQYRTGITYGKVYAGIVGGKERSQYTMLGSKVNLAARFMMKAGWKEIWTDGVIYQSLKDSYNFEQLPEQSFKGFEEKLSPYKLTEEQESEGFDLYSGEMVGRDVEMKKMIEAVSAIHEGKFAGVIYINGEIGIGKTRLAREFRKELENKHKLNWFYCTNEEIIKRSLNPFKYFLTNLFNQSPDNSIDENKKVFNEKIDTLINKLQNELPPDWAEKKDEVAQIQSELERTRSILGAMVDLQWEGSLYEQLDPQLRFENTMFAFYNLVIAECLIQPVIIEIEDAQWLDKDSIELLNVLARNIRDLPLAIVFSSRYLDDGSSFSLELDDDIPKCVIDLNYLSPESTKYLAEQILNNKVDENVVKFLNEKTNGNPYFIEQLVLDFKEREIWKRKDDVYTIQLAHVQIKEGESYSVSLASEEVIPSSINSVLLSRFDRLTEEVKDVVKTASVLGREFEVMILSQMLRGDVGLKEKIKTAEEKQIWTLAKELRCLYKHALLRDVVYNMQMRAKLSELHLLAANSLKELYGKDFSLKRTEQYSYHFGIGNNIVNENNEVIITKEHLRNEKIKKNVEAYLQLQKNLADEYENGYDNNETINKCETAINISRLLKNQKIEIDYLIKKGKILEYIGKWDKADHFYKEALQKAEEAGDVDRIGNCNTVIGEHECNKGEYKRATTYLDKALDIFQGLKDQTGVSRIISDIGTVYYLIGDYDKALSYYEKSLKILEEIGVKKGIAVVVAHIGNLHHIKGEHEQTLKCYERSLKIAKELGNKLHITQLIGNIGNVYSDKGDFKEAMKYYEESLEISKELGFKEGISQVTSNMGNIYGYTNQHEKAIECYEIAIRIGKEIGIKFDLAHFYIEKADLMFLLKKFDEAKSLNNEGLIIAVELAYDEYILKSKILASKIEFVIGEKNQAIKQLRELQSLTKDESNIAYLYYEFYKLLKNDEEELISKGELEKYRKGSIKVFEDLYSKTSNFKYKRKLEELTSEND